MSQNYPATAIKITFRPLPGRSHVYRIWQTDKHWLWYALGNSGMELTQEAVMEAARNWIRNGVHGVTH